MPRSGASGAPQPFHRGAEIMRVRSIRTIAVAEDEKNSSQARTAAETPATTLSESDAARFLGMSAAWLKKSRTKRFRPVMDAPPFIRAGAKRIIYRIEDLQAWQERHLEHVTPEGLRSDR